MHIHCIGDTVTMRPVTRCREFDRTGMAYYRQLLQHWRYFFLLFSLIFVLCAPAHQIPFEMISSYALVWILKVKATIPPAGVCIIHSA